MTLLLQGKPSTNWLGLGRNSLRGMKFWPRQRQDEGIEISSTGGAASPAKRAIDTQTSVEIKSGSDRGRGQEQEQAASASLHLASMPVPLSPCNRSARSPGTAGSTPRPPPRRTEAWPGGRARHGHRREPSGTRLHQTAKHPRYGHPDRLLRAMQDRQGLA